MQKALTRLFLSRSEDLKKLYNGNQSAVQYRFT